MNANGCLFSITIGVARFNRLLRLAFALPVSVGTQTRGLGLYNANRSSKGTFNCNICNVAKLALQLGFGPIAAVALPQLRPIVVRLWRAHFAFGATSSCDGVERVPDDIEVAERYEARGARREKLRAGSLAPVVCALWHDTTRACARVHLIASARSTLRGCHFVIPVCLFFARRRNHPREAPNDLCTLPRREGRCKGRGFPNTVPLLPPSCRFLQAHICKSPLAKSNLCDFQIRRPTPRSIHKWT